MSARTSDASPIARAAFADVSLYDPKRTPVAIDLTDNTNLWGPPPHAAKVLRDLILTPSLVTRYPTPYATGLKEAAAAYAGVTPDMVATGNGSDQLIDVAMRAFGDPDALVAATEPTFAMAMVFARMNGLRTAMVAELPDHDADVDGLLATSANVLYICSPNNPTGALVARRSLERLIDESAGLVIIDEAYVDFAGVSNLDLIQRSPRVVLLRTMSKAFGLAGLRVGYALAQAATIHEIEKARGPYAVSGPGELAAATALQRDVAWVEDHIRLAIENRDRLTIELLRLGLDPMPSSANFVCVPVPDAAAVNIAMRAKGVAVRPFPGLPRVGDAVRISVGPWPMMERCIEVLCGALAKRKRR